MITKEQYIFPETEIWINSFNLPTDFNPNNFTFAVSGFRSSELLKNPQSLVDPYFGSLFASIIGKSEELSPNKDGQKWRLRTFRPWGAIISFNPEAIMELRDHDPGPPEIEDRTPSLHWRETTPLQVLNNTTLHNEMKLRLDRRKQLVKIEGFFCFQEELESTEAQSLKERAREMNLPFIVLDSQTGSVSIL